MKFKIFFIMSGVVVLHGIILTGVCFTGGCRSASVLEPRPFIPAPAAQEESKPAELKGTLPEVTITTPQPPAVAAPPFKLDKVPESVVYTVQKNDSFWKIARKYGVSMQNLAAYNNMPLNKVLRVGQKLKIPPGGYVVKNPPPVSRSTPKKAAKPAVKAASQPLPADGTYTVKSGDSFWKIAKKYNLKTKTLLEANNMTGRETLQIGQKLVIPTGGKTAAPTAVVPAAAGGSVKSILDTVGTPDDGKSKTAPETAKKAKTVDNIDDFGDPDSDRAVQVLKDIKVEDFAKQYKTTPALLKKLNDDYPADGVFKAGSVVIIRSAE
ncbi:MAG: LysM peptidoglycan-binding domain-containing protein [Victivallaceae bacterium]|nr:LysM peptidoglycan-binding domain-containing protein [Victivallaceae bacterium]